MILKVITMHKYIFSFILVIASALNLVAEQKLEGTIDAFLGKSSLDVQPVFRGERFGNIVVLSLIHI